MRRFITLILALALGAALLWHFESERQRKSTRAEHTALVEGGLGTSLPPEPVIQVPQIPPAEEGSFIEERGGAGDSVEESESESDGTGEASGADDDQGMVIYDGEFVRRSGQTKILMPRAKGDEEGARYQFVAVEQEQSGGIGTKALFSDVEAEAWVITDPVTRRETLRSLVRARGAELEVEVNNGMLRPLTDRPSILEGVVIEQRRGTPLAPLTLDAPRIAAWIFSERYESVEDDRVTYRSRSIRGGGQGFSAQSEAGSLHFTRGADATVNLGEGRLAKIVARGENGRLELDVVERAAGSPWPVGARRVRIVAAGIVELTFADQGAGGDEIAGDDGTDAPIRLDAENVDVTLEFRRDADRPVFVQARAEGGVIMRRDVDVYRGGAATFSFDDQGRPTRCTLEQEPSLEYRLVDEEGRERPVTLRGLGPLEARFARDDATGLEGDDVNGEFGLTFLGPGRVVSVNQDVEAHFRDRLVASGLLNRSRFDATLVGDVRASGLLGDLASDELVVHSGADGVLSVETEGPTRVSHRPAGADETFRLRAEGGVVARSTNGGWYVVRAVGMTGEALGADPYRVEAAFVRDVDLAGQTLQASENVLYRTSWGSAFAPVALARGPASVELRGTPEDPVCLDLLPADVALQVQPDRVAAARTGWLRAPSMTVTDETVLAEDGVAAQLETFEAVWAIDAEAVLVKRTITGLALNAGDEPLRPGELRPQRAEELRVEANFLREARYDAVDAHGVFRASRFELDAALVDPQDVPGLEAEGSAAVDPDRNLRMHLLGDVSARLVAHPPVLGGAVPEERPVLQSWDLEAAEALIVRRPAEIEPDGTPGKAPYSLNADEVTRCHYEGAGRLLDVVAGRVEADGTFGSILEAGSETQPDLTGSTFVARDTVSVVYKSAADQPSLKARGHVFVLVDGKRGTLRPEKGKRVRATGVTPGEGLPYTLVAQELLFQDERLEVIDPDIKLATPLVLPDINVAVEQVIAPRMVATRETISFPQGFEGVLDGAGPDQLPIRIGSLELDPKRLRKMQGEKPQRTLGPFEPTPPRVVVQDDDEDSPVRYSGVIQIPIPGIGQFNATDSAPAGDGRYRYTNAGLELAEQAISIQADTLWLDGGGLLDRTGEDLLVDAVSMVIRSVEPGREWELECATMTSKIVGDEMMITLIAPEIKAGDDSARADYLSLWVDRAVWSDIWGTLGEVEEEPSESADPDAKPNFLAELLFELQSQKLARYVRALFMEGSVEIARADRRAAKGSRLYIDLQGASAWLEDAELVYPLQSRGEEVPLRVRTERFQTNEQGALTAKGATLTTCDHDVPHFVVRTRLFSLEPRGDGGWRFAARGNRLRFQGGLQLPLPSIGNLVLDENFGVEGFENEAGEVTPLRDIAIARTARFGTVLGAAFRFDIGDVGSWVAERIGMDTDHLKGKWDTQAQWLGSRGPLLGMGLFLREREPGNDPDEDFRLDAFVGGIPDTGEDRGVVRVPDSEREDLRLWGYVRSRYPIVRGEWIDVAIASQTDAGAQPEFYENEFLRFEQRDTFVNWRKSLGADYLSARIQKRVDDFRSQKEELPTLLAYRGERKVGVLTGSPILWGGAFEAGYFQRRQGELGRDLFSDLPFGADPTIGNAETGRADLRQRLSLPIDTTVPGLKATPFVEARGTAWTDTLNDEGGTARGGIRAGAELSTVLHKVTGDGYLHTLAPRLSASADVAYEETDESIIPLDAIDNPYDGTIYEAGLRALWSRPATFENFDLDLRGIMRRDRETGSIDSTELGVLSEYITRYGSGRGQIGLRHDARYDVDLGETVFSRSALAIRPSDVFIAELQYGQARAIDRTELYETAGLLTRWRLDPKWEIETRYVHDLQDDQQLFVELVLRRFSHDFVFDISVQDRAGEGSTTFSFNLAPLLGWTRSRLGMLDRQPSR